MFIARPALTHTVLGAVGGATVDPRDIELLDGVREVVKISASYKLASRAFKPDGTVVKVGPAGNQIEVGGRDVVMMAGPCTVESQEQIDDDRRDHEGIRHPRFCAAARSNPGLRPTVFRAWAKRA